MRALAAATLVAAGCAGPLPPTPGAAPTGPVDQTTLGVRLMQEGEAALALRAFNRAIARDGPSAETLTGVAAALYTLGQPKEATRIARSAVDLDPNLAVARNNLGVMLYEQGDYGDALAELERAYALTAGAHAGIATNLGIAEHVAAQRNAEVVIKEDAEFDLIQFGHGVYRLEKRRPDAEDPT